MDRILPPEKCVFPHLAGWQSLIEISNTKNLVTIAFDVISLKFAWKIQSWLQPIVDYLLKSRETKKRHNFYFDGELSPFVCNFSQFYIYSRIS